MILRRLWGSALLDSLGWLKAGGPNVAGSAAQTRTPSSAYCRDFPACAMRWVRYISRTYCPASVARSSSTSLDMAMSCSNSISNSDLNIPRQNSGGITTGAAKAQNAISSIEKSFPLRYFPGRALKRELI
eukprot:INCI16046.3.p1 GENE.INCI16046.3~~INCI16046.3.p1  ORF type:complete len:130 (+),score=10.78 INCI16046.3:299-688(+)